MKWLDEMTKLSPEHILLSFFFTSGGTVGGWALTGKLAGDEAAMEFLQMGVVAVFVMVGAQALFFRLGEKRLICRLIFHIFFGFGIVWFMLCLLLPMLWVQSVGLAAKALLFLLLVILCVANLLKAAAQFESRWRAQSEGALARHYNSRNSSIDWPEILLPMKLSMELCIPGVPVALNPFISLVAILAMLAGLSLRNAYPIFSLYAWGIPSCLVISLFMQAIGLGMAQIITVVSLEKKYGERIQPKS
jgi:hypothetical protein